MHYRKIWIILASSVRENLAKKVKTRTKTPLIMSEIFLLVRQQRNRTRITKSLRRICLRPIKNSIKSNSMTAGAKILEKMTTEILLLTRKLLMRKLPKRTNLLLKNLSKKIKREKILLRLMRSLRRIWLNKTKLFLSILKTQRWKAD